MKIYYWDSLETLAEWTNGMAVAYAPSKERAIELILEQSRRDGLKDELHSIEPKIITNEWAIAESGSA